MSGNTVDRKSSQAFPRSKLTQTFEYSFFYFLQSAFEIIAAFAELLLHGLKLVTKW